MSVDLITRAKAVDTVVLTWWNRTFDWGEPDCAHLVNQVRIACGLESLMKDVPAYSTLQTAHIAIRKMGFKCFVDLVSSRLEQLPSPLHCLPGDVVAIRSKWEKMPALGILIAPEAVLCFVDGVCQRIDMQFATGQAWRIG